MSTFASMNSYSAAFPTPSVTSSKATSAALVSSGACGMLMYEHEPRKGLGLRRQRKQQLQQHQEEHSSVESTPSISFDASHMQYVQSAASAEGGYVGMMGTDLGLDNEFDEEAVNAASLASSIGACSPLCGSFSSIGDCSPLQSTLSSEADEEDEEDDSEFQIAREKLLRHTDSSLAMLLKAVSMGERYEKRRTSEDLYRDERETAFQMDFDDEESDREDCRFYPAIYPNSQQGAKGYSVGQISKRLAPNFSCIVREACGNKFFVDPKDPTGAEPHFGGRYEEFESEDADDYITGFFDRDCVAHSPFQTQNQFRSESAPIAIPTRTNQQRFFEELHTPTASGCHSMGVVLLDGIQARAQVTKQSTDTGRATAIRRIQSEPVVMRKRDEPEYFHVSSDEESESEDQGDECMFELE